MLSDDIQHFARGRTKARAYFCYLFSNNLPDKIPDVSQSMIVPRLLSLKADLENCEGAYLLDHKGQQVTPTYLPEGKEDTDGIGRIRADRAYYYRAVKEKRCTMTDPYPSLITGDLTVTASHPIYDDVKTLKYVACIDMPIADVLNIAHLNTFDTAFSKFFKFAYMCFALALTAVALLLFGHGIQSFFVNDISISHLSIDEMFKATILLTLSLAIFDLVKTLIEEEVLGQHKEHNISGPHKTMVKFLGSIIIALSIEALMLVFKFAITDPNHLMNAMYIVAGVSMLILSMAVYIKFTKITDEADR
ncbi:PDC sensor domain-containing protein [Sulfurimonas sp. SAG-AH-194-I05]|nr:PDC sensor domain-containing protein [Sulfurimonas sp. SAG-AH-194-I05]MDF1874394.1 PDC sensor domain-containing protein [Sulfurimonas sp. SAG-AH-194-I05]